jgi:hypothetical protein
VASGVEQWSALGFDNWNSLSRRDLDFSDIWPLCSTSLPP